MSIETERLSIKITVFEKRDKKNNSYFFDIHLKNSSIKIGRFIMLHDGELGFNLEDDYQRQGYGTEVMDAIKIFASEKGMPLIINTFTEGGKKLAQTINFVED